MVNYIKKHFDLIGYIALAIFFVVLNYYLYINMDLLIDSDMASEMIYAKLLVDEKTLLSSSWYFSTGIETVNIPLVFAPVFLFTNNWHIVRIVGIIILDILLYLSFYYVCKQLNIKHIPWLAFLILGCISYDYFYYVIRGSYYIPFIAMAFVSIGLVLDISKSNKLFSYKTILLILASALSGLGGIRQVAQCYACIFGTSILVILFKQFKNILNKRIDTKDASFVLLKVSSISFIASIVGYLINKLLLESRYTFNPAFDIKIELSPISRILDMIYHWITLFGYQTGNIVKTAIAALIILFTVYCCIHILKKNKDIYDCWIVVLYLCMNIVTTCIFLFTNMMLAARYYLLAQACIAFVYGVYLKNDTIKSIVICVLTMIIAVALTISQFKTCLNYSTNEDLINIKNVLIEQECYNGYGSFWYANVFTELSDGKIEAWSYHSKNRNEENVDIDNLYKWLQKKEHFEKYPEGRTFLVLSSIEQENANFKKDVTSNKYYAGEEAILYIFNSKQDLFEALGVQLGVH